MTDRICMNCGYYESKELECRRYPPTPVLNGYANGDIRSTFEFPNPGGFTWCGEFVRRTHSFTTNRHGDSRVRNFA